MRPHQVLYLTFDGILSPLGFSQVVRVVDALAQRGAHYTIVSLERAADLADRGRVEQLRDRLAHAGVQWRALTYDNTGSAAAAGRNLASAFAAIMRLVAAGQVALIHPRGYQAAMVALAVNRVTKKPYLFDARGYWIDERVAEGRWFVRPTPYAAAKKLERQLYQRARGVVTLTDLQADDLRSGRITGTPLSLVTTITTSADFDAFVPDRERALTTLPPALAARLAAAQVIGLVGSLNGSYRADDTARLCRRLLDHGPDAHLLVLSAQHPEYQQLFARHGIAADRYTLAQSSHEAMPSWLACIDWSPLLLHENFAKRASMPTKLGEFFAAGVRPIQFGCNPEVSDWVRRTGTGLVLSDLDDSTFDGAAQAVRTAPRDLAALERGREIARDHFSLATAVDKYQGLLAEILG